VTVGFETPFLLVVEGERMGRRRGREWKRRKAGRSSLVGQTLESLAHETKGGGREISTFLYG